MRDVLPPVETVTLEKIKYALRQPCLDADSRLPHPIDVSIHTDILARRAVADFETYVWGRKLKKVSARWPRDWLEAMKERWAPKWWKRWRPVRWCSLSMDATALWPAIRHIVPDQQPRLDISVMKLGPVDDYPYEEKWDEAY